MKKGDLVKSTEGRNRVGILCKNNSGLFHFDVVGDGWLFEFPTDSYDFFPYGGYREGVKKSEVTLCTLREAQAFKKKYPKAKFNMPDGKTK